MELQYQTFGSGEEEPGSSARPRTRPAISVEEALEELGFGWYQIKVSLILGLGWISDVMQLHVLAVLGPILECEWRLQPSQAALLSSIVFVGLIIGATFNGVLSDKYGRRVVILLNSAWTCWFAIMTAFSPLFVFLVFLRLLTGIGLSGIGQGAPLFIELIPRNTRGRAMTLVSVASALGAPLEMLFALLLVNPFGWRWWLLSSSLPLVAFLVIAYIWLPESLRYDITSGNRSSAAATLECIAMNNSKPLIRRPLVVEKQESRGNFLDIFKKEIRTITIILALLWILLYFLYYGTILLCTELIAMQSIEGACAKKLTMENSDVCLPNCKMLAQSDYIQLMLLSLSELLGMIPFFFLIDTIGRKPLLILKFSVSTILSFSLLFCTARIYTLMILFVLRATIASCMQALWTYTLEVYPTSVRGTGFGFGYFCARIGAMTTPFVAQVLIKESLWSCFAVHTVISLSATIGSLLLPIDTTKVAMKSGFD